MKHVPHGRCVGKNVTFLHQLQVPEGDSRTNRVSGIGETVTEVADLGTLFDERFVHELRDDHGRQGQVGGAEGFRQAHRGG